MERYGFFSSINEDRLYTAQDFTRYFSRFLQNGYFSVEQDGLKVTTDTLLNISVTPGTMWINGHVYELLEPKVLTVDTEANLSRRDRVVVVLDYVNREIRTEIKKGIPSGNPEYPVLERNEDKYEMCIAQYQVDKGITQLIPSMLIDTRKDVELCGEVTSILDKRSLLDFCQITGFNMEGDIKSKNIVPNGQADIGAIDNRYNKIYCKDIDIENDIPYLSLKGGEMEGDIASQSIRPAENNTYDLGSEFNRYNNVYVNNIDIAGEAPFIKKSGDTVENKVSFNDLEATSFRLNGKNVYIQSEAPLNAVEGSVWIKV